MEDSVFTKIIKGEIPAHKVYEDDKTIAFLDIHPIQPGHVLVVPKAQVDEFQDLKDEDYVAVWAAVQKVAKRQKAVLGRKRVGIHVIGLDVPHAHIHVFPFDTLQQYRTIVDMTAEPDHPALAEIAKRLAF
ncbi:MAG TPA: HIT family protein [Candidatus Saccharimonadales bacterium]|nr:HIT family protein [Candidatus Saccharimonadales bacterium]